MTKLNDTQLIRLDATLLLVFQTAMETRKLGEVAARLGLTPSAISHAMTRLRDIFEDQLSISIEH
jgi:DNA-binding transcriptional LysR family regulator